MRGPCGAPSIRRPLLDSCQPSSTEVSMWRIGLAAVLSICLTLTLFANERTYIVGLLTLGADPVRSGFWQEFLEAMRELDYVEGRNLTVRPAFANGDPGRLTGLVAELMH